MSFATADLYDEYEEELQIAKPMFNDYGGIKQFSGPALTLKVFEDNSLVRAALEEPGLGKVLIVEGGASLRCALLGDMLAELGVKNGWVGIIVHGCIRDSVMIGKMNIGVKALNTTPRKSVKKGVGVRDIAITFADVTINPGDFIYADEDGFVVAKCKLK
ncbi:MAG: ribonuclease activity regulator protein RraA [Legionellales bacterium]|nr:ribonuclease activity regulator protein RraA [Legionellales bacterium]|tara:strand:- start:1061 stop:1540 length:480 start_codon:yes stop_codon:yes gene_type:complete